MPLLLLNNYTHKISTVVCNKDIKYHRDKTIQNRHKIFSPGKPNLGRRSNNIFLRRNFLSTTIINKIFSTNLCQYTSQNTSQTWSNKIKSTLLKTLRKSKVNTSQTIKLYSQLNLVKLGTTICGQATHTPH